jgi:hypothetical protein
VANGLGFLNFPFLGVGDTSIECVPSRLTVRVTCPTALQTATGQFWLGRWAVNPDPRGYANFAAIANGFISFGHPRPLTAAKMAVEGVEVSALPRDMNKMADFLPLGVIDSDTIDTVATYPTSDTRYPWEGLTPIFLVAEGGGTTTDLNIQVAVSWRWRFRMDNVAASTHRHYTPSDMKSWNKVLSDGAGKNGVGRVGNTTEVPRAG